MNLTKKLLTGALAFAMIAPMMTLSASASAPTPVTKTGDTVVSYDNTNDIPDPDNPDNPDWAVTIPSSVSFTDKTKKINTDVSIISKNGGDLPEETVTVSVKSQNGYKLHLGTAGADDMGYALEYAGKTPLTSGTSDVEIGQFVNAKLAATVDATKNTLKGDAILSGTATKTGAHTDKLTYTVSYTPTQP